MGRSPQDFGFKQGHAVRRRVGHRNVIREYVIFIAERRADSVTASVTATSSWSARTSGMTVRSATTDHRGHIAFSADTAVDDGAFLGGGSGFHRFVRVGRLASLRATPGSSKDVPPLVAATGMDKVAGLNFVGLRRAGFSAEDRAEIKAAFRLLYESDCNVSQALAQARAREWGEPAQAFSISSPAPNAAESAACDGCAHRAARNSFSRESESRSARRDHSL